MIRVITTGVVEVRGEMPELDAHGHPTGDTIRDSAVVSKRVVLVDELVTMLETRRKTHAANGYHERVDEIDNILREISS